MVLICESVTLIYTFIISFFTKPNFGIIVGNFLGLFLMSSAFVSIGLFLSSITENQIIAATSSFGVGIFFLLLDTIAKSIPISSVNKLLSSISFMQKYSNFTSGILELSDVVFFISVIFVFLFFTVRFFEKRRWS
jgi:ABC-2 type transport system permease protein